MKNINKSKILLVLCAFALNLSFSDILHAEAGLLEFGFFGGLSIPNDKVSNFFTREEISGRIDNANSVGNFITKSASDLGYHLGVRLRGDVSNNVYLQGGVSFHRFNQGIYDLSIKKENSTEDINATCYATTNIIPISFGINCYLFKGFVGAYLLGDLTYNIVSTSLEADAGNSQSLPIATTYNDSRPGCDVGAGIDFDLELFLLNIEGRYNFANIIARDTDEPIKNYVSISVGVTF